MFDIYTFDDKRWCNGPPARLRISRKASECKNTQVHIHWQLEDEDIEYHETEA